MSKKLRFLALLCIAGFSSLVSVAQTTVIKGKVKNSNKESINSVSISVKGTTKGTNTDANGNFSITVSKLPITIVTSSVGYVTKEIIVNDNNLVEIFLAPSVDLGQEIIVSASRVPQRIIESPVSIERVSAATIKNSSAASYYDIIGNLKGVDLMTSSLTFKTPTTRGFNGSGNTRFTQLIDGMDNQAPGLNFSVGTIVGLSELDVDNMELLPGASSALYGPGGMNGTLLITSKNPFKYQGLSFQVKTGILHTDKYERPKVGSFHNWSVRYAKKITEKFAFKITADLLQAKDWIANDYRNYARTGTTGSVVAGTRETDPNYDGVNVYGDETTIPFKDLMNGIAAQAPFLKPYINTLIANNPNGGISRTGYKEGEIIDPNTVNFKVGGSLNYKITDNTEASVAAYFGTGNSVYTGSERYSLLNLKIAQYKVELTNKKWMLRAYTTQENSGDSYNATVAARLTNEAWMPSTTWYPLYGQTFIAQKLAGASDYDAHNAARAAADATRPAANSNTWNTLFSNVISKPIGADPVKAGGAKFLDKSDLYSVEGQYNLSSITNGFADLLIGGNYRKYVLNSQGTLFADSAGAIGISEYGGYLQVSKEITPIVKLVVSGRYDKNQNFEGKFTPRATATFKVNQNAAIRASFQTAYRFPTTQQQWINLDIGSNVRLLGANANFNTFYKYSTNPIYTLASVMAGAPVVANLNPSKPESVTSYELGYKGIHASNKLLIDIYGYYGQYKDFIVRSLVVQAKDGNAANLGNASNRQVYSIPTNSTGKVTTYGWGVSLDYRLGGGFNINTNVSSDILSNVDAGLIAYFNSPKYRANVTLSNNSFGYKKRMGFGVTYRWADAFFYEGDFANGDIPQVQTIDAQINYKIPAAKSTFKLGANNLLNQYYRNGFGNPMVGGLYYVSYGYNF